MHPTSSAQKENILSLASHSHSTRTIASRLGLSQSTVSRTVRTLHPCKILEVKLSVLKQTLSILLCT